MPGTSKMAKKTSVVQFCDNVDEYHGDKICIAIYFSDKVMKYVQAKVSNPILFSI